MENLRDAYSRGREILSVSLETLGVIKLELYFHSISLSSATAFTYRYADEYYLVTNYHVLSGVNPITGDVLSRTGCVPNRIELKLNLFSIDQVGRFDRKFFSIELIKQGKSVWYDLGSKKPVNDVAILCLDKIIDNFEAIKFRLGYIQGGIGLVRFDEKGNARAFQYTYPRVGENVFILGFPLGMGHGDFPIWKRGSVATEPLFNVGESPIILVDAATRQGMSGAPVLYYGSDVTGYSKTMPAIENPYVVGVYAGREGVTQEENSMALGRVWKVEVLEYLIQDSLRRRNATGE